MPGFDETDSTTQVFRMLEDVTPSVSPYGNGPAHLMRDAFLNKALDSKIQCLIAVQLSLRGRGLHIAVLSLANAHQ